MQKKLLKEKKERDFVQNPTQARNWGSKLDIELSLEKHVVKQCSKTYASLSYLYKFKHFVDTKVKISIINLGVLLLLESCDTEENKH